MPSPIQAAYSVVGTSERKQQWSARGCFRVKGSEKYDASKQAVRRWPQNSCQRTLGIVAFVATVLVVTIVAQRGHFSLHGHFSRHRHDWAGVEDELFEEPFNCPTSQQLGEPFIWTPDEQGKPMQVKVLVYNLYWWSLFKKRGGNQGSAGKLIRQHSQPRFDFMGFQECFNVGWVLSDAGLQNEYELHQGPYGKCLALHRATWEVASIGHTIVAEDTYWNWFGRRGVQFLRAKHRESGKHLLFMNFHGALSVNSGGKCGGWATAHSLLKVIRDEGQQGDTVIFVGDFNSNLASALLQELRKFLLHVYSGLVFGGVDNVFSNVASKSIVSTERLGRGGSDHDAISAVFKVGQVKVNVTSQKEAPGIEGGLMALKAEVSKMGHVATCECNCDWNATLHSCDRYDDSCCAFCCCGNGKFTSRKTEKGAFCKNAPIDWSVFWCGRMENGAEYEVAEGGWEQSQDHMNPDWCCKRCQEAKECKAWTWNVYPHQSYNASVMGHCRLIGGRVIRKRWRNGFVSGYAATAAAAMAEHDSHMISTL